MTNHKPYLNELKNKDEIEEMGKELVNLELLIDDFYSKKQLINDQICQIESKKGEMEDLLSDVPENDEIKSKFQIISSEFSLMKKKMEELDNKLSITEKKSFQLKQRRKEAIRMGLIDLYHKAKNEYEKTRSEWIKYTELSIKRQDRLKKQKKILESIENVFKVEFGDEE